MPQENLKQQFDILLKETIVPALKQMGFNKKGQHFYRQSNDIFQCFNIQKSKWNSYNESLSFTFNIGFYSKQVNNTITGSEVTISFPQTTDCFLQGRIGHLTNKREHWYEISNRINFEKVNSQVRDDLENFLSPYFDKFNSLESLKELIDRNKNERTYLISPISEFVFLMTINQTESAIKQIRTEYKNALTPQATTQTINYPDGTSKVYTSQPYVNQNFIDNIKKITDYYDIEL